MPLLKYGGRLGSLGCNYLDCFKFLISCCKICKMCLLQHWMWKIYKKSCEGEIVWRKELKKKKTLLRFFTDYFSLLRYMCVGRLQRQDRRKDELWWAGQVQLLVVLHWTLQETVLCCLWKDKRQTKQRYASLFLKSLEVLKYNYISNYDLFYKHVYMPAHAVHSKK